MVVFVAVFLLMLLLVLQKLLALDYLRILHLTIRNELLDEVL